MLRLARPDPPAAPSRSERYSELGWVFALGGGPLTPAEILARWTGDRAPALSTLAADLRALHRRGLLLRVGTGRRRGPYRYTWFIAPPGCSAECAASTDMSGGTGPIELDPCGRVEVPQGEHRRGGAEDAP